MFCGEKDDSFKEEGLDVHYWKFCPMLKRCGSCKQVGNHFLDGGVWGAGGQWVFCGEKDDSFKRKV